MHEDRSLIRLVHSPLDLKRWMTDAPLVDEARPASCPCCAAGSRPLGQGLVIVGHGRRSRQQRGPLEPGAQPVEVEVKTRRYRCKACGAILVVAPRGVVPRRLYSGSAIAWALALLALCHFAPKLVRDHVSPWTEVGDTAFSGWAQLRRWICAVRAHQLFESMRPCPASWRGRAVAERCATTLAARAPPAFDAEPIEVRAFFGAAHAA